MLTEEDKNRIRLEETYRQELRRQLEEESSHKSKADPMAFLNSAFFLWFLSTVLIGTISFLYTRWDKNREDERRTYEQDQLLNREKNAAAEKLDTEIANRLRFVNGLIETEHSFAQTSTLIKTVMILEKPSSVQYPVNVFPEYSNRSFQSLLWELMQVVPESERKEIAGAFEESKKLSALYISPTSSVAFKSISGHKKNRDHKDLNDENEEALNEDQSRLLKVIGLRAFDLERWGKPLASISDKQQSSDVGREFEKFLLNAGDDELLRRICGVCAGSFSALRRIEIWRSRRVPAN